MRISKVIAAEIANKLTPRTRDAFLSLFGADKCKCGHLDAKHNRLVLTLNAPKKSHNGMHRPCSECKCKAFCSTFKLKHKDEFAQITTELISNQLCRSDWDIMAQEPVIVLERAGKFVLEHLKRLRDAA